uniref:CSON006769 protein n=1 Tax=Culicoides sonorensis TaxID=179676 RepID=A0A336MZ62_CULSO
MFILTVLISILVSLASATTEIIASNHPKCTEMGEKYINTFNVTVPELAIIVSVCEGIVNPQYSGLGGGFIAVIFNGYCSGKGITLNSRESAPQSYEKDSGKKYGEIGVPSMLKGYQSLYEMELCGMKPVLAWKDLFTDNIELAENGWDVLPNTKKLLGKLKSVDHNLELTSDNNKMRNPKLSETLKVIAQEGPSSSFYRENGYLFEKVMTDLRAADSFITPDDLLKYKTETKTTFQYMFFNYTIATTRIPGSGSTMLLGCKMIESVYHRLAKLSYEKRFLFMYHTLRYMYSLKPYLRSKFLNLNELLDNAALMAWEILQSIDKPWDHTPIQIFGNYRINDTRVRFKREFGTANIVLQRGKSAITMTSTVNWYFGSRLYSKNLGIFYNNQLKDFDDTGTPNGPKPGKVPQSSTSVTILYSDDRTPVFQIGAAGGSKMIGAIFNTFFNYFVNNMTLHEANKEARCTPQYKDNQERVVCENGISLQVKNMFEQFKAPLEILSDDIGAVTASSTIRNKAEAVFDVRRGGKTFTNPNDGQTSNSQNFTTNQSLLMVMVLFVFFQSIFT